MTITPPGTPRDASPQSVGALCAEARRLVGAGETGLGREKLLDAIDRAPDAPEPYAVYASLCLAEPRVETSERGVQALIRMLRDGRVDHRGPQIAAAMTLQHALDLLRAAAEKQPPRRPPPWFSPLLTALLAEGVNGVARLEPFLIGLRADLLRRIAAAPTAALDRESGDLLEALARHGFRSEYIWPETEAEERDLAALQPFVESEIAAGRPAPGAALYALAAYRPLHRLPAIRDWAAGVVARSPDGPLSTLRLILLEPVIEAAIAARMPALTPIADGVSSAVREQYEQNPYPRWGTVSREPPRPYVERIAAQIRPNRPALRAMTEQPQVLVAGCGSGRHPIRVAQSTLGAHVLGVDLSLASLAYASRQAQRLGVENVSFAQADILLLNGLEDRFDVVEASGVIHHMEDPEQGLRQLLSVLKPGGFLKLGLYSAVGRRPVTAARAEIAARGYSADLAGLRRFRRDLLAGEMPNAALLALNIDFFSASNLRDLAFHVQEHQFDLPRIKALLEKHDLEFLGFSGLPPQTTRQYAQEHPEDPTHTDLDAWRRFEDEHPFTFSAMYQFWCRKG